MSHGESGGIQTGDLSAWRDDKQGLDVDYPQEGQVSQLTSVTVAELQGDLIYWNELLG